MDYLDKARDLSKRQGVKDIFTLQVAQIINRVLNIVTSVLLARMMGVEGYGLYSLIFVFTSLINLVDIGYTKVAVVLLPEAYTRQDKQEITNILSYLFKINFYVYFPAYLLVILFSPYLTLTLYQNFSVGELARYVIVGMMLVTLANVLNLNLEAQRKMKHLSILENGHLFLRSGLSIFALLLGLGLKGVVIGYFLAELIVFIASLTVYAYWSTKNTLIPKLSEIIKNMRQVKYTYHIRFSFSIFLDSNLGNFLGNLPALILSLLVSPAVLGFYRLATSYMSLPLTFLSPISRLLNVKFPQDKVKNYELLKKNFLRFSLYAGILFVLLIIPFIALAQIMIPLFYGREFLPAVNISYWVAGQLVLSGFAIAFGPIYRAARKVNLSVLFNVIRTVAGLAVFATLFYLFHVSALISVLMFQIFIGSFSTPIHYWFIKKYVLNKMEIES